MSEASELRMGRAIRLTFVLLVVGAGAAAAYDSLPAFFMALAGTMALLALIAMYQSFRGVFGDRRGGGVLHTNVPEQAALEDEKNTLLRAIKDIAYEREVGKLSEEDFTRLDRAYRLRAKEVLRKLDADLAPYLERAEQMLSEPGDDANRATAGKKKAKGAKKAKPRRECPKCETKNAADAEWCKQCGAPIAPIQCDSCGAENEADARFCIKCASALTQAAAPAAPEAREPEGDDAA